MEAKLREYRARRRRQELVENTKEKLEVTKNKFANVFLPKLFNKMDKEKKDEEVLLVRIQVTILKVTKYSCGLQQTALYADCSINVSIFKKKLLKLL